MITQVPPELSDQPVVRHYRAPTRAEVEQAYRTEALQAAAGGYVPVSHNWSQDSHGFLLAVTYGQAGPARARQAPVQPAVQQPALVQPTVQPQPSVQPAQPALPTQPIAPPALAPQQAQGPAYAGAKPPTIVAAEPQPIASRDVYGMASPGVASPVDRFATSEPQTRPDPFAPADSHWMAPAPPSNPVPPIERYTPPAEMYRTPPGMYVPVVPAAVDTIPPVEQQLAQDAEAVEPGWPVVEPEWPAVEPAWSVVEPSAPVIEPVEAASMPLAAIPQPPAPVHEPEPEPYGRRTRLTIQTLDLHSGGEPLRIIRSGFPDVPNLPVLERRRWVLENADHVRRSLMLEPRGHRDMYGAILLPPYNDYADMCALFMHNEGYSTMCGHGIIAITTGLIEEGLYPATEPVTTIRYEVPAGIVAANAATVKLDDGTWAVRGVRFTNVPSYLAAQSLSVRPDGVELRGTAAQYGALGVDLAFGGAYYGIVNAAELGLRVVPEQADALRRAGAAITEVLRRDHSPAHPTDPALSFVYGTIIVDLDPRSSPDGRAGDAHIRNATIFANAELDRSPCGSGTSAILAQLHARGRIRVGQEIVNAGITGEHFLGRIEAATALGPYPAVTTSVAGTAYVTGYSTFIVDSRDPLGEGFLLG